MEQKFELLPAIENYDGRQCYTPKARYGRNPTVYRDPRVKLETEYTVAELSKLLDGPHAIWGFDPSTGRAELLRRSALEWVVKNRPKRKGTIRFSIDEHQFRSLHLIPSYTRYVPLYPQY